MSKEDIFTIFGEDYRRRGVVLVGYKSFGMELLPDVKSVFGAEYVSGAILRVPLGVHTFLLPSPQDVNVSNAKTGSLELELSGSGSAISVFFKSPLNVEPTYDNYYPPCKWCAAVLQTIELLRGDELIVCSKTTEILSATVYGWMFKEVDMGIKPDDEEKEPDKEKIAGKEKSFWERLKRMF